jgi:hypothetical protein
MNKKMMGGFSLLAIMLSVLFISDFASAKTLTQTVDDISVEIGKALRFLLGDVGDGETFFVKVLFALIIFAVVYYSVRRIPNLGEGMTLWILSIAVSLIAVRFLANETLIEFLWLPQGVLGVALATLLPFILFFFFIESFSSYPIIRKVGWSIFAVVYVMLALLRWEDLVVSNVSEAGQVNGILVGFNLGWFYLIIAVLSILAILFDKAIHSTWLKNEMAAASSRRNLLFKYKLQDKLTEWEAVVANPEAPKVDVTRAKLEIKKLTRRIEELG